VAYEAAVQARGELLGQLLEGPLSERQLAAMVGLSRRRTMDLVAAARRGTEA